MKNRNLMTLAIIGALSFAACGEEDKPTQSANGETSANIVISGTAHHFSDFTCFKGFSNDIGVLLSNNAIVFEVSQLRPSDNTWTVKLYTGDFSGDGNRMSKIDKADEYFTRKYDVMRAGNKIIGKATAERGKLPRNPVEISIDVTCQKMK